LTLRCAPGFTAGLNIGASVSVDGAWLTVTHVEAGELASFDVIQETLSRTTLAALCEGSRVNVERAAQEGAEIGSGFGQKRLHFTQEALPRRLMRE
jgi:riboflavin synthase